MKPRIRVGTRDYEAWLYNERMRHAQREYNLELSQKIDSASFSAVRFVVNSDVMMPAAINPKTGFTKYIKAP